ncbi:HNH endonuclease [Candidatus Binatus sp.]|jgi:hypothetical protein|uniref:HNH endonuclease n=1 Tax=Candidatus Binatus sp. TaxID=2811406 RepID=UPI003CAC5A91
MPEQKYRCIYCLELLRESQFNREHVLPQHLGRFQENFVLHRSVCLECNDSLGKQLETWLGRHSYEGLLRLRFGQKPVTALAEFQGKGVAIRLPPGSSWAGAILILIADSKTGELRLDLRPQIGVKRPADTEFRFFTDKEFEKASGEQIGKEKGSAFKIIGLGQSGSEKIIEIVRERIPDLKVHGSMPDPPIVDGEVIVEIIAIINDLLARSIAKIAFNYLSYVSGSAFVLDPAFNEVRRFIRYGEGSWRTFVTARERPIVENDHIWYGCIRAHLVVLDWPQRGDTVHSSVSLFNETMYDVRLGSRPSLLWRPIRSGHAFFWETGEIKELVSTCLSVPWQTSRI